MPEEPGIGLRVTNAAARVLEPDEVAGIVIAGVRDERFLILPRPQVHDFVSARALDHPTARRR